MSRAAVHFRLSLFVVAACVVHAAFASWLAVRGARPDLALVGLAVACLFLGPNAAALYGFAVGLFEGSLVAMYLGSFLVSRSLVGFSVGALDNRLYRDNVFIAAAAAGLGTLAAGVSFFLFAPQPGAAAWMVRTAECALYNAILAVPCYLLVRRLLRRKSHVL